MLIAARPIPCVAGCAVLLLLAGGGCMKAPDPDAGLRQGSSSSAEAAPEAAPRPAVSLAALDGWTEVPPSQGFYLAEWNTDGGGKATITWLGGSAQMMAANLQRWLGQFSLPDGGDPSVAASTERDEDGNWPFTFIALEGTLNATGQVGGGAPREDWMLLGAIVESEQGPVYVKWVGPAGPLREQRAAFRAAVQAMSVQDAE